MKLPMPYSPSLTPYFSDKHTARVRGFTARYLALDLALPDEVAAALAAHARLVEWAGTPQPEADNARDQYRRDLLDAATAEGGTPPDPAPVITALARADAATAVATDTAQVSEELHLQLMGAVLANLDEMIATLATEHDDLIRQSLDAADSLPATITTGEAAAVHSEAAATAWRSLDQIGHRLLSVRHCRVKAAALDPTRGAADYALFRHPDRFPTDEPAPVGQPAAAAVLDLLRDPHAAGPWCPTRAQLAEHAERMTAAAAHTRRGPEARRGRYIAPPMWDTAS